MSIIVNNPPLFLGNGQTGHQYFKQCCLLSLYIHIFLDLKFTTFAHRGYYMATQSPILDGASLQFTIFSCLLLQSFQWNHLWPLPSYPLMPREILQQLVPRGHLQIRALQLLMELWRLFPHQSPERESMNICVFRGCIMSCPCTKQTEVQICLVNSVTNWVIIVLACILKVHQFAILFES